MPPKIPSTPPVTYHLHKSGESATQQAGVHSGGAVEKARPPRVAEVRPTEPAKPVRGIQGRASILSARSFFRLAACLVGAIHGASAEAQVGSAGAAFPSAELDEPPGGVDDMVGLMTELGVEVFYVAQGSGGDHSSLSAINAVLHGVCTSTGVGARLIQPDIQLRPDADVPLYVKVFDNAISKNTDQIGADPHGRFMDFFASGKVEAVTMPSTSLDEAIKATPNGTVIGLSKDLAFHLHHGSDSNSRPSALIVTTQTVSHAEVEELWELFNKDNFTAAIVPLEDGVQAMIVAPSSARWQLWNMARKLDGRGVHPLRYPPDVGPPDDLVVVVQERPLMSSAEASAAAGAIVGASVLVYKCARRRPAAPGEVQADAPKERTESWRELRAQRRARRTVDEGAPVGLEQPPVMYQGLGHKALPPQSPEEIAKSVHDAIREKQDDKVNGKTLLRQYLRKMGEELRTALDPDTGGGAEAAAEAAFKLSGIIDGADLNTKHLRRWCDGAEFMNGVNFDFVFQTVKDYQQLHPEDKRLEKAAAMLRSRIRLVPRGEEDHEDHKGRQGPAQRPERTGVRNRHSAATAARATSALATPADVTIADIYAFGKELAVEEVPEGANRHAVRLGKDIFIPSAVIVPHWHLTENFLVYKHDQTNHVEVARGSDMYPNRAGSVAMRLDKNNPRDYQILRIQRFIQHGTKDD